MSDLEKRRSGKYTCLDCLNSKTKNCSSCKFWDLFLLDKEVASLSYEQKNLRYDMKNGGIG